MYIDETNVCQVYRVCTSLIILDIFMSRVLVFGAACLDYIAEVDHFPSPDEKLRTNSLTICGGGNAGNTATCLNRLGVSVRLISKIALDINGDRILQDLCQEANIDTNFLIRSSLMTMSPLSYIIVDRTSNTRTCLFSADHELIRVDDVRHDWLNEIDFIHFDSRSTEAAVELARLAEHKSIQCSIDLERHRPHIDQLIARMTYIFTTEHYCRHVCNESDMMQAAVRLLRMYHSTCRFVIITRGKDGCILVERTHQHVHSPLAAHRAHGSEVTREVLHIDNDAFLLWTCNAWPIEFNEIIDTTGSGDAFIGGIIYGLLTKDADWPRDCLLRFASYIAMCKLKGVGARTTLPCLSDIDMQMFA
jgi:sugar/nucleoside kinase (ribokinase family)